jgi:hypothetical protein
MLYYGITVAKSSKLLEQDLVFILQGESLLREWAVVQLSVTIELNIAVVSSDQTKLRNTCKLATIKRTSSLRVAFLHALQIDGKFLEVEFRFLVGFDESPQHDRCLRKARGGGGSLNIYYNEISCFKR